MRNITEILHYQRMINSLMELQNLHVMYYFCITEYFDVNVRKTGSYAIHPHVQLQKSQF